MTRKAEEAMMEPVREVSGRRATKAPDPSCVLGPGDEACGLAVGDDGGGVGGVEGGGEEVELEPSGFCVWTANSWTSYKYSYR